ncbi:hypothetical protein [Roseimicrobium sp. ORNL1]|uniref:hypothetical protein n=1 Tax=Roseimicrobium sp. ORNL1 TaxID=2711231 RepID=UPI00198122A7|nr:hypothetical protein [Roseimicrobium sp. ORNL1]
MMEDNEDLGKENDEDELETDLHEDGDEGEESSDGAPALERNLGTQPIDAVIEKHALKNHDVVQMNRGGLTHKIVQKARKGRRLKPNMKVRVTEALNVTLKQRGIDEKYGVGQLFNY